MHEFLRSSLSKETVDLKDQVGKGNGKEDGREGGREGGRRGEGGEEGEGGEHMHEPSLHTIHTSYHKEGKGQLPLLDLLQLQGAWDSGTPRVLFLCL